MPSYSLSRQAASDLRSIYIYTANTFGRAQAVTYKNSLEATLLLLAENPVMGRSTDQIRQNGVRRHEHASHIIFYRLGEDRIDVVRVLPARADWSEHL